LSESAQISVFGVSETGNVREENQDAIYYSDASDTSEKQTGFLFGIADGMGGFANGSIASKAALETLFETYEEIGKSVTKQKMKVAIQNANLRVYQEARRLAAGRMGTTLTCVHISGSEMMIGHVGDTRAYLVRNNTIQCLTNDHTRVAELIRMNLLPPEKARTHSQRSVLDRCLGIGLFVQPDIFTVKAFEDDIILLCSDGVWAVIEDDELLRMTLEVQNISQLPRVIIDKALELQSDDNVSCMAIHLQKLGSSAKKHAGEEVKSIFSKLFDVVRKEKLV
jgi:protein phosphatase